jgi:hypothetical protein
LCRTAILTVEPAQRAAVNANICTNLLTIPVAFAQHSCICEKLQLFHDLRDWQFLVLFFCYIMLHWNIAVQHRRAGRTRAIAILYMVRFPLVETFADL